MTDGERSILELETKHVQTDNYNPDCFDGSASNGTFCQTDNRTLTWFERGSITNNGRDNIRTVLEASFEATVLSVSRQDPPVYSGGSETDIIYFQGDLMTGVIGMTWCNDAVSNLKCDQHYIKVAYATPSKKLICHESGHAVGLTHGDDASPRVSNGDDRLGCMQQPAEEITDWVLGSHNKNEINATY